MQEPTSAAPPTDRRALIGYVGPMLTYLVLSQAEALIPPGREATWYPIAYAAKAAATLAVLLVGRSVLRDLRKMPTPIGWAASVGLGLLVTAAWVGLDGVYPPLPFIGGSREAFDPTVLGPPAFWAFVAVRMAGLVLLVPVFEELFWRSFLMRTVIDPEIERVPVGLVTPTAAAVTSAGFMLVHPEWLPALLTGLAWAGLLRWTGSLSACVASHATANLALGIYVLAFERWEFW